MAFLLGEKTQQKKKHYHFFRPTYLDLIRIDFISLRDKPDQSECYYLATAALPAQNQTLGLTREH